MGALLKLTAITQGEPGCLAQRAWPGPRSAGLRAGELDVAGLIWTPWDLIKKVRRAGQAISGITDAIRTGRGFHVAGMEYAQVSGH
jgi:hypothetical protein